MSITIGSSGLTFNTDGTSLTSHLPTHLGGGSFSTSGAYTVSGIPSHATKLWLIFEDVSSSSTLAVYFDTYNSSYTGGYYCTTLDTSTGTVAATSTYYAANYFTVTRAGSVNYTWHGVIEFTKDYNTSVGHGWTMSGVIGGGGTTARGSLTSGHVNVGLNNISSVSISSSTQTVAASGTMYVKYA